MARHRPRQRRDSLINRQSGLAIDVWERLDADGARISQYAYTGSPNQRFLRRPV